MKSKASFLLQMMAVSLAWAIGPVMSQTASAISPKVTPARAETCSFVPASADGKEQICVKAPSKKAVGPTAAVVATRKSPAVQSGSPAKSVVASGAVKTPSNALSLKPTLALKTPPTVKATDLVASKVSPAVVAPATLPAADSGAPVAPVAAAPATIAPLPLPDAAAPAMQRIPNLIAVPTGAAPATAATASTTDPVVATPRAASGPNKLGSEEAARRFTDGQQLERKGEAQAALLAYLAAAESGNGQAQKRLGDIYGTGTAYVERDYGLALKWYERARAQGVEIPKPFTYSGLRY